MRLREFGDAHARRVLIQPVDARDLAGMEAELAQLRALTRSDFRLVAVEIGRWNHDLSPWSAPAVFRDVPFGDGAADTLAEILALCRDDAEYHIGGYSLAGLFALWAACETDRFSGVAAASPSVWFPGFAGYLQTHTPRAGAVYLSLGNREEKTRNGVMATVGDRIRETHALFCARGIDCALEWNEGSHFRDPEMRTAKAFAWLLNREEDAGVHC